MEMKVYNIHTRSMFCRRAPICYARKENKPIFESYHSRGPISPQEAREIHDICKYIKDANHRQECYSCFGMDGEAVERFLPIVEDLELCYEKTKEMQRRQRSLHLQLGPFHIYFCKD